MDGNVKMIFELNDDEFQTLNDIFSDWGSDCPGTDYNKYQALGEKLGILEPIPPPTEEELKRREEFKNSEVGKAIIKIFSDANSAMSKMAADIVKDNIFMTGMQWNDKLPIGTRIAIRLPKD